MQAYAYDSVFASKQRRDAMDTQALHGASAREDLFRFSAKPSFATTWKRKGLYRYNFSRKSNVLLVAFVLVFWINCSFDDLWGLRGTREVSELYKEAYGVAAIFAFVTVLYTNVGYVQMTKNFVCNILALDPEQISRFVFISSSKTVTWELTNFDKRLKVVTISTSSRDASYGTFDYFRITLDRLVLQNYLIQRGLNVFVVEADATWFSADVFKRIAAELQHFDFVTTDDYFNEGEYNLVSAGFLACKSTPFTQLFFRNYVEGYRKQLLQLRRRQGKLSLPGEQVHMTHRLRESHLRVSWLDVCRFSSGKWYNSSQLRQRCPHPEVLQNNWIVGNDAKMQRARQWQHWFLNEYGVCSARARKPSFK